MRVLVIGCGSIGTRRAKLLAEMGHEVCGVDPAAYGNDRDWSWWASAPKYQPSPLTLHLDNALQWADETDVAFICTPPDSHYDTLVAVEEALVSAAFIEKPMALDGSDVVHMLLNGPKISMVACNTRFDYRWQAMNGAKPVHIDFRMGQHSSNWSPNHQPISMILDDIHELDLAVDMLGSITGIDGTSDDDQADVRVTHQRGTSHLVLDRLTNPPIRQATFHEADGKQRVVNLWPPDSDMYRREMEHFLDCVEKGMPTCNPIEVAAETTKWALEVA